MQKHPKSLMNISSCPGTQACKAASLHCAAAQDKCITNTPLVSANYFASKLSNFLHNSVCREIVWNNVCDKHATEFYTKLNFFGSTDLMP